MAMKSILQVPEAKGLEASGLLWLWWPLIFQTPATELLFTQDQKVLKDLCFPLYQKRELRQTSFMFCSRESGILRLLVSLIREEFKNGLRGELKDNFIRVWEEKRKASGSKEAELCLQSFIIYHLSSIIHLSSISAYQSSITGLSI